MDTKDESPVRGLKNILKKKRAGRDDGTSTLGSDSPTRSTESIVGKTRFRTEPTDNSDIEDSKISKLIPGLGKLKDKKRRKSQPKAEGSIEELRGRSDTPKTPYSGLVVSPSASTLNDERSSLLTSDSEDEGQATRSVAPPLISRESHAGYLTSSSPGIRAAAVTASPALSSTNTPSPRTMHPLSKSTTLPSSSGDTRADPYGANPGNRDDNIGTASMLSTNLGVGEASDRSRSISPISKPKDSAPRISGSLASRRLSKGSDTGSLPGIHVSGDIMSKSNQSVPSIVTIPDSPIGKALAKDAPNTTITPPTPVNGDNSPAVPVTAPRRSLTSVSNRPNVSTPVLGNTITHRRIRSDSNTPSKLSQIMSVPLTPTLEEMKTPGLRNASGNTTSSNNGFFSSVFSAAQNAASTISSTLSNNTVRPRSSTSQKLGQDNPEDSQVALSEGPVPEEQPDMDISKAPAINTIGSGDLNFGHLGLSTDAQSTTGSIPPPDAGSDSGAGRSRSDTVIHDEEAAARNEGISAARAVSAAYGIGVQEFPASTPVAEDIGTLPGPSVQDDEKVPVIGNGIIPESDNSGIFRSGSLRSSVRKRTRRHRNSSSTGAATIGAAIGASYSALTTPANASAPKITGFAVANKKRNKDFHQFFRSVPEDDYLIEDYSCALQRDIILAGRIYISEGHICFSSNILGWVTTLVISFDEVVSVEKESTAMLFANAIAVQTLHARHTFRSLLSRDATYDLIIGIWKINHPGLQSSENGVRLATGTGSKTEKVDLDEATDGSEGSVESGEIYDEDDDDSGVDGSIGTSDTREASLAGSDAGETVPKAAGTRKPSAMVGVAAGHAAGMGPVLGDQKAGERAVNVAAGSTDFPGPAAHAPTECADSATHYDKLLKDEVIPAPLGKVYAMVFGAASGGFMSRWLMDDVKVTDLQMEDDKKGLTEDKRARSYAYIKPLTAPLGPKTTKCLITEQLDAYDLEKAISVTVTTQTPDVPSGNMFCTKTRYCFMWGPNNGTRIIMCFALEWTGKSWIKGAIEKGANDGQITYANDLVKALRAGLSARARNLTSTSRGKKVRKRRSDGDALKSAPAEGLSQIRTSDWGLLEPVHKRFGPIVATCKPLFSLQSLIGLLLFLLIISWFRNSRYRSHIPQQSFPTFKPNSAQRLAAYEELWHSEEAALWAWLEDRVGMSESGTFPTEKGRSNADRSKHAEADRSRILEGFASESRLMSEREVDWAIKLTEDKLKLLKQKAQKGRYSRGTTDGLTENKGS